PAVLDCHVLTLDVAGLLQALAERGHKRRLSLWRCAVEESDHRHRRLLCACCKRPRSHAAEQRDELAPLHSITSSAAIRGTGRYGISTADRPQSALMLRARITLPHFSVSSAMSFAKSAGESASASPPRSASRALSLGSARPALISLLSFSTISAGVAFGAPTP